VPSSPGVNASKPPSYLPRIDVLRGYAILMVLGVHFCMGEFGLIGWNGYFRDFNRWSAHNPGLVPLTYGWAGVPLFFVISGFCIHYGFLARPDRNFGAASFFWRRFTRLYPTYFAALLFFVFFQAARTSSYPTVSNIVSHVFLIDNLSQKNFDGIDGPCWSLAVEAQFYLLYPLLLWGRRKLGLSTCFVVSLLLNLACSVVVSRLSPNPAFQSDPYRSFPLMTWCDWILGACVAEGIVTGRPCFSLPRFFLFFALAFSLLAANFRPLIGQAYLFTAPFFAVILQGSVQNCAPLNWREKCLVPFGLVSYSLYLWHSPLMKPLLDLINHLLPASPTRPEILLLIFQLPILTLVLFLVAGLSYYVLEVKARQILTQWGRSFLPRGSGPIQRPAVRPPLEV
jgi:peptidoglycan/LPS O-acetylase OafA/YrhL